METGSLPAFGVGRVPLDPWKNALPAPLARFSPSVPVVRPAPHLLPVGVPGENFCVLRCSQVMDDMEARLRLAAVAYVGGARPPVSCVEAARPSRRNSIFPGTRASSVVHQGFKLFFRPWIRQAQAIARVMRVLVDIMIEGIPSHAWEWETADKILGSSCDIISLAPETASREDLSLFKLRAWCRDPNLVPVEKRMWIPEPVEEAGLPAARRQACCQLLEYPTLVHIGRMRDFTPPENWRRPASSDDSGQSGLPDDSDDSFVGGELQVLPWSRGVRDSRGPARVDGDAADAGTGQSYAQALVGRVGPSSWRVPPLNRSLGAGPARCATPAETPVVRLLASSHPSLSWRLWSDSHMSLSWILWLAWRAAPRGSW
ncbi:hypothetical protein ZWY2020_041088 [Hordeum vulgare]|nr:hypothetical protein ZWY2020_041088 [Hordeum vulgare]